jgi:hypothetical protein
MSAYPDFWAVDDAAAEAGITRQRLNELILAGRYSSIEVPYRPERVDAAGKERKIRYRLLTTDIVQKIKADRAAAMEERCRVSEAAERKKLEYANRPKARRGRPRKLPRLVNQPTE